MTVQEIYETLTDNEKWGIQIGMFPFRIKEELDKLGHDGVVGLMDYDKQTRNAVGQKTINQV